METILVSLLSITALFLMFLFLKNYASRICAICLAVSVTWIILLVLFWQGYFGDKVLIGLLIGQSIVGIYYLLEQKVSERMTIFRLPFLLSLMVAAYTLLEKFVMPAVIFVSILWVLFGVIYIFRTHPALRAWATKIMECCKRW